MRCASSSCRGSARPVRHYSAAFSFILLLLAFVLPARADIASGIDWLAAQQRGEGSYAAAADIATAVQTTAETLHKVARRLDAAEAALTAGDTEGAIDALVRTANELRDANRAERQALRLAIAQALRTVGMGGYGGAGNHQ